MLDVRKATTDDASNAGAALASAFGEDPVFRWMCGKPDTERRMTPFWRHLTRAGLARPDHEIYVGGDGASVAVWRGIDQWKVPGREVLTGLPASASSLRFHLPSALKLLTAMEKAHPTDPHYYLEFLGTRRERQGQGAGSALMEPMLQRCDAEGVAAYLASSNPRNVSFYFRHGFVETGVIAAPRNGPKLTTMWREPRT